MGDESRIIVSKEVLLLASGSPRRRDYFRDLGLSFAIVAANIEERIFPGESAVEYIQRLALAKAEHVAVENPDRWVVAADTVVCCTGEVLEKPADEDEAVAMLLRLSGQEHTVKTALCLLNKKHCVADVQVVSTRVRFWKFSEDVARVYVESGESMDKAGSYGIQGKGGVLVQAIHGSYSNVVGLPLCEFIEMLGRRQLVSL